MAKFVFAIATVLLHVELTLGQVCQDKSESCAEWLAAGECLKSEHVVKNCRVTCGKCDPSQPSKAYDMSKLPIELKPIGFLVGRWRAEFEGKARFPTIPIFTYGEQVDYRICETPQFGVASLNYTAFAWSSDQIPLHSEYGTIHVRSGTTEVSLVTVMNNGFITVEEGQASGNTITLKLIDIGRISWSRDLPVLDVNRECTLIDQETLDCRLTMQTLTNVLQEHTYIRYTKIYP